MENGFMNKIIGLVLVLVIGATLVGGLLVPTVQAVTATESTFENEGYFHMSPLDDDYTFSWDYSKPTEFIINDETIIWQNTANMDVSVLCSEHVFIRVNSTGAEVYFNGDGAGNVIANSTNPTLSVSRSAGEVTATNGNITRNLTDSTSTYAISDTGEFVLKKATESAYMKSDSMIYGRGYSSFPPVYFATNIKGDIAQGVTANVGASGFTTGDVTINYEEVEGYIGLYSLSNLTFVVTDSDSGTHNVTYSYFIVPAEVTAEKTQHMDASQIAIFGVVGLLGIVLLVTIAASAVRSKY